MEKIATRQAYGEALQEYGADPRVVVLDADLSKSTKTDLFRASYPERFFSCGIAESNMVSTAAGLAACGKVVFGPSMPLQRSTKSGSFWVTSPSSSPRSS